MIQTKKSLGQNFLKDKKILNKILDFARIEKEDTVLEIGPGEGSLTELLLERVHKVISIEKDENLAEQLSEKLKQEILDSKLEIVCADVLEYSPKITNYKLVGNIPYYITGAIFRKFLETENQPKSITFVVQKEVAERIVAKNGKESVLSISIKAYGEPVFGGVIKAGSFYPKPKVDSAIISVIDIGRERFENITPPTPLTLRGEKEKTQTLPFEQKFFEILKKGFAHKRKFLIKNLGLQKEIFQKCSLSEKSRAEDLSVDDWVCLAK